MNKASKIKAMNQIHKALVINMQDADDSTA